MLTNLAISSIHAGQHAQAVGILNQLKKSVEQAKSIIDGHPDKLISHVMNIKVLQLENCELRVDLARLSGNEEEISMCEEELNQFDLYVTLATADLSS